MSLIGVITLKLLASVFVIYVGYGMGFLLTHSNRKDGYPGENPNDRKSRTIKNIGNFIGIWVIFAFATFAIVFLIIKI